MTHQDASCSLPSPRERGGHSRAFLFAVGSPLRILLQFPLRADRSLGDASAWVSFPDVPVRVCRRQRGILDPSLRQLRAPIPPRVHHDMTRSCRGRWQSGVIKYMERIYECNYGVCSAIAAYTAYPSSHTVEILAPGGSELQKHH